MPAAAGSLTARPSYGTDRLMTLGWVSENVFLGQRMSSNKKGTAAVCNIVLYLMKTQPSIKLKKKKACCISGAKQTDNRIDRTHFHQCINTHALQSIARLQGRRT